MAYIGKSPDGTGVRSRFYYTQTSGGGTSVSGSSDDGTSLAFSDGAYVDVFLNGVLLVAGTDYNTTTANTIAGLAALANGDVVEVVVYDIFTVADTVSSLNGGTFASAVGFTSGFTASDGCTITTDDNNPQLTLTTTDADAGTGPTLDLFRNSASPADADVGGKISFTGKNDAGETLGMTIFQASHVDVSDGTEDAKLAISSRSAGSMVSRLNLDATETVFNEDSVDLDFRVESNGSANMLFVDGGNDRVGIGTNGPSVPFEITTENSGFQAYFNNDNGSAQGLKVRVKANDSGDFAIFSAVSASTGSERTEFTILDDGILLLGNAANAGSFASDGGGVKIGGPGNRDFSVHGTGAIQQLGFHNPNGEVGSIFTSGSATTFSTSSDYRLKENVADMTGAIARVKQLAPKRFNFIADADTTLDGFLAHEAQAVVPEAVIGTHNEVDDDGNAVMQGIDQSKLVPLLTGALKEAIAKIETLETKVAALESGS